jgi:hypothetical protein
MAGPRKKYTQWYKERYGETPGAGRLDPGYYNARWRSLPKFGKAGGKKLKSGFSGGPEFGGDAPAAADTLPTPIDDLPGEIADIQVMEKLVSRCRVYNDADFSHNSSGNWLAVTFNSERWDKEGMHEAVTNPSRITIVTGGLYVITGHASFAANATGLRSLGIRLGGATFLAVQHAVSMGASLTTDVSVSTIYALAEDQYIELVCFQNSGSTLLIKASPSYSPELSVVRF